MKRGGIVMESIFHSGGTQRPTLSDSWYPDIIAGGYEAVIFDCDGTLVESRDTHFRSFQAALRAQGHHMNRNWYYSRTGLDRVSLFAAYSSEVLPSLDVPLATKQSIQEFIDISPSLKPVRQTADLVRRLDQSHAMAVGTNAEFEVAKASLQATDLLKYFDDIVSISDELDAKPAPDIFLQATKRLGFKPSRTLVFEDSSEGVNAALAAGLDVIQLVHS